MQFYKSALKKLAPYVLAAAMLPSLAAGASCSCNQTPYTPPEQTITTTWEDPYQALIANDYVLKNDTFELRIDQAAMEILPEKPEVYLNRLTEAYDFIEDFFGKPLGEPVTIRIAKTPTEGLRWCFGGFDPQRGGGYTFACMEADNDGDVHEVAHKFVNKYMLTDSVPLKEGVVQLIQNLSWYARAENGNIETYNLGDSELSAQDAMYRWGLKTELDNGLMQKGENT